MSGKSDRQSFLALWPDGSKYSLALRMTLYHTVILLLVRPDVNRPSCRIYSSYLGGSGGSGDAVNEVNVDSNQNVYLARWTNSTDFSVTSSSAFQPTEDALSHSEFRVIAD
jgi:hypothetical protein